MSLPDLAWVASYVCPWGALLLAFVVFMRVVDRAAERVTDQLRPALPRVPSSEAATQVVPAPVPRSLHAGRPPPTWEDEVDTGRRTLAPGQRVRGGGALVPDYTQDGDRERTEADER